MTEKKRKPKVTHTTCPWCKAPVVEGAAQNISTRRGKPKNNGN